MPHDIVNFRRELVQRQIQSLLDLAETADEVAIRRMFKELVPEFRPNMPGNLHDPPVFIFPTPCRVPESGPFRRF